MARPAKYSTDQILDAALEVVADAGAGALTVTAVAHRLGAPSGSIYHRFPERDVLAASLWLRSVGRFQAHYRAALDDPDPRRAARAAAVSVVTWSREHTAEARLLMQYRSEDLLTTGWPESVRAENRRLRADVTAAITALARRLGATDRAALRRLTFAIVDVPYAAVRAALARGHRPDALAAELVAETVAALLTTFPEGDRS